MPKRALTDADRHAFLRSMDADGEGPSWEQRWFQRLDRRAREAEAGGEFGDLAARGQPQVFRDDALGRQDARWLGFHVLQNAGFVPPWVEASRRLAVARARSARGVDAWRATGGEGARAELEQAWTAENAAIRAWNAQAPSPEQQRYPMPIQRRWELLSQ